MDQLNSLLAVACPRREKPLPIAKFLLVLRDLLQVKKLQDEGRCMEALEVADKHFGASDDLLLCCAKLDVESSWKHISRLRDTRVACEFALKNLRKFPLSDALDALQRCKGDEALSALAMARLRQVQCCAAIASLRGGGVWGKHCLLSFALVPKSLTRK